MSGEIAQSYRDVPYPSLPRRETQPDLLAALATLHGVSPPAVERCRVLEIGCSDGGNLLAAASLLPKATFFGIDLSPEHVALANTNAQALGVQNTTFAARDILDVSDELGEFDYVIAHGIYSWVPPAVQDRILAVCTETLSPQGVAYVGYKTYPGWHLHDLTRGVLAFGGRGDGDPLDRLGRGRDLLKLVAEAIDQEAHPLYRRLLEQQLAGLTGRPEHYLVHEYLEAANHPKYFCEFVAHAKKHGLQYLTDARFALTVPANFLEPQVVERIEALSADQVELEQHLDLLTQRAFRWSLLCRADLKLERSPGEQHLRRLFFAGAFEADRDPKRDGPVRFVAKDGSIELDEPAAKRALDHLTGIWPRTVGWKALLKAAKAKRNKDARDVAEAILAAHRSGLLHVCATQQPAVREPGPRPTALPFTRLCVSRGGPATNVFQSKVGLDQLGSLLLPLLNGEHDLPALLTELQGAVARGEMVLRDEAGRLLAPDVLVQTLEQGLPHTLTQIARAGLLLS